MMLLHTSLIWMFHNYRFKKVMRDNTHSDPLFLDFKGVLFNIWLIFGDHKPCDEVTMSFDSG